jgi:type IV pilus assembly protein PilB
VDADAPLIRLVNQIIVDAFKMRASDIHLEPLEKRFRLRYRIDGVMQEMKAPPKRLQAAIIARLKIQSNMSISEHRIPQDGRIQSKVGNKLIDLRVSCLPTNHGESIVMRILDKEGLKLGLPELGFFTDDQQTFERIIGLPDGICSSPARPVPAKPRRCIPACTSSTGRTAKSSPSRTRWNIFWPASTRCRSTKPSG